MQGFATQQLVGREKETQAVLADVRSAELSGALLVAEAGMGKSALAGVVIRELEHEMPVFRIHASSALTGIPFGALAPLLPVLSANDTDSPLAVMRALLGRVRPAAVQDTGATPLLVVDDAHALDEASADLLSQLMASGRVRMLALTRSITEIPAGIPAQVWSGAISRHHLQPFTEAQVHELCTQVLGGPVLTTTSAELAIRSGGNPMFTLALIAENRRTGALTERHGVWLMGVSTDPPQGRLADLLKVQLSGLSTDEREAMEIIALAEPVPVAVAFKLGLHRSVDALTAANLVSVEDEGNRLLRPRHPLYGQLVRHMVPAARSARLRRRVQEVMPDDTESMDGLLRSVAWSLDCGAEVPDGQLLRAAYMANNFFDSDFALRAAGEIKDPALLPGARIQMARAHYNRANFNTALELVTGTVETAADLTTAKLGTLLRVQLLQRLTGEVDGLHEARADWEAAIQRIEAAAEASGTLDAELRADLDSSRRGASLLSALVEVAAGNHRAKEASVRELLAEARQAQDAEAVMVSLTILGEILSCSGRAESAVQLTREALGIVAHSEHRFLTYYQFVLHRHLSALLWSGYWDEVLSTVHEDLLAVSRSSLRVGGTVDMCLAVMELRRGNMEAARPKLMAAIEGMRTHDPDGNLPVALSIAAQLAARAGDLSRADELLADCDRITSRGTLSTRFIARGNRLAAGYARTGDAKVLAALREAGEQAEEQGLPAAEFELRCLSMRAGDPTVMNRLLKLSEDIQGPRGRAVKLFARSVLDQDVSALLRFASEPADAEANALGVLALQEALRIAKAGGDRNQIQRVQRVIGKRLAGSEPGRSPAPPSLTRREKDVARLVARGCRNAEIAGQLFLSVRTVEGHIYRIFEKLGISRREELTAELMGE
ncbi:AAA family ATPase [Arthrobacter gandavensis]|uniref:helix-turn-helix transcriptional regulator n=1 Tax=Arthrobacter gandavensis TaxID=169960 RepID=UPI00189068EF|nr:LuxR family transcriptional regulator [Arthrobacter gandavensis]MBF4993023.1 AAA family ATPase [Arthrobacter gandavensis]